MFGSCVSLNVVIAGFTINDQSFSEIQNVTFDSAARGLLSNHLKLHVRLIVATTDDSVDVTWKASESRCI
jgi:hypothetical protein